MKTILIIFYLSISLSPVFAQEIVPGKYCTTDHYSKLCFDFFQDSTFDFYQVESFYMAECGKGHFIVVKDTLILHFNDKEYLNNDSTIVIEKQMCEENDSVDIDILAYNYLSKEPLCFAVFNVWGSSVEEEKELIKAFSSDFNGKASFRLPKSNRNLWLEVKYVGYRNDSLSFSSSKCQKISIGLIETCIGEISSTTFKYKIKRSNEKQLILLNLETGYSELLKCKR